MVEAMGVYQRLRELQFERAIGRQILDRLAYPLVLVDSLRGLLFRNSAAAEALNARDYIVDQGGMLACCNQSDDAALTIAIQNLGLQETDPSRPRKNREAVRILRRNGESRVGAFLSALRPSEVMGTFGTSSVALIVFHDPKALPRVDPFILAEAFDLTPAEAKVAVEVSHGKTADEVAAARSVALGTVRAQIKSALAKTGVHRQSDLVRLVMSLPRI
jgi:DNA-binding CsgD family transcriptional regulator